MSQTALLSYLPPDVSSLLRWPSFEKEMGLKRAVKTELDCGQLLCPPNDQKTQQSTGGNSSALQTDVVSFAR